MDKIYVYPNMIRITEYWTKYLNVNYIKLIEESNNQKGS